MQQWKLHAYNFILTRLCSDLVVQWQLNVYQIATKQQEAIYVLDFIPTHSVGSVHDLSNESLKGSSS